MNEKLRPMMIDVLRAGEATLNSYGGQLSQETYYFLRRVGKASSASIEW